MDIRDFLSFHHRLVRSRSRDSRRPVTFLARWPADSISVSTAEPFATTAHVPQALRLALGSIGLPDLRRTLTTVRQVVDEDTHR